MKCCTLPDGVERKGGRMPHENGRHRKRITKLSVAVSQCAGKKAKAFRKCVKAKIRKMK